MLAPQREPNESAPAAILGASDEAICARKVETEPDVEALRQLRNGCRLFMTRDQRPITVEQQRAWWARRAPELRAYLFTVGSKPVGFGIIRQDVGRWWLTLGVDPGNRGRGIGTAIYRFLVEHSPEPPWIEVRSDNIASLRAAARAGFQVLGQDRDHGGRHGEERDMERSISRPKDVWLLYAGTGAATDTGTATSHGNSEHDVGNDG